MMYDTLVETWSKV